MFERYTDDARKVIFFGRYEASRFGSSYIEAEHLFLGLIRQYGSLADAPFDRVKLKKEVESRLEKEARTSVSTSVDMPMSEQARRVLAFTAAEAKNLGSRPICLEHLLLGFLRDEVSFPAELLRDEGLELEKVRERLQSSAL